MNAPLSYRADTAALRSRNVTAVLGPTNTGKTHLAIERMLGHDSGLIGLPLRLLAREVYDKMVARTSPRDVALITGEEKIKPPSPRYYVCTVEAMPREIEVDFLAVDEIQLAADGERGHVFTNRLFHARGASETLLLGAATMRDTIRELLPGANIISRPRLSKLSYAGQKKLSRLPRRSAVVAFAAQDVYAIAELIRRQRGGTAVVLGALSPRTRNAQVALYQNGDVDFLVATDAIGMGLNLDVDHVAFAAIRKFDGQSHRELTPAEVSQIAGRAGRHMNDGTFGITGTVAPFDNDLVARLEAHEFDPVQMLQWRNTNLDYASLTALRESLKVAPSERRLARARMVDDVIALENVSRDEDVRAMAAGPAALRRLWEVCQIPDYRKISTATHAELVATLYKYLMSDAGHIPEDWFAQQVGQAERTDGDIDTLANRIAHIRTWTFVSHRADWLADAEHWQERTREIEDKLSDALHEGLTRRFVDRRTSTLMRRLRDKDTLYAEIGDDGAVEVERHFVGRLDGFRFTPDAGADGIHGKAARNAAAKVLATELARRADRLLAADASAIVLTRTGTIEWLGQSIASLERGDHILKPGLRLLADDHLSGPDRERITQRLESWLTAQIRERIAPLVELSEAEDVDGLARGVGFRLTENLGILKREDVADEIRSLDQEARGQLRKYGVRFGALNIYIPALLKPAASDLVLLLWALHHGEAAGVGIADLPEPPREGLTSAAADKALPAAFYRTAGFHHCGARVVRIDMLERLADMIRPLVAWRPSGEADEQRPEGATGNGGFRVQPNMMSIVGCSGEDFAAVLRALGFRVERRRIEAPEAQTADTDTTGQEPSETETAVAEVADAPSTSESAAEGEADTAKAEPAPQFDEIWRPKRRRPAESRPRQRGARRPEKPAQRKTRGKGPRREKQAAQSKRGDRPARKRDRVDPDSPFAALAKLKQTLKDDVRDPA